MEGKDDRRYFIIKGDYHEVEDWAAAGDALQFRLRRLIYFTIPWIDRTNALLKEHLSLDSVHFQDYSHDNIQFECRGTIDSFFVKIDDGGNIYRKEDSIKEETSDRHLPIGQLPNYIMFSPDRMKKLMKLDAYLEWEYGKMKRKYKDDAESEYRVFELLFNAYVLDDSVMENRYAQIK